MDDQPAATTMFDIVSVKGFGDLVIALTCLRRVRQDVRSRIRLLLGEHLLPLAAVFDLSFGIVPIRHADSGPAALFQVRSRSPLAIARSALTLRTALQRASKGRSLVFDEIDIRHRSVAVRLPALALPARDNLYRAWYAFLDEHDLAGASVSAPVRPIGSRLHIFPGAREAERRLSPGLLRDLVDVATRAGLDPQIIIVAGEMPHLHGEALPLKEIPRDFARTLATVSQADRIISADSMTAHLAEYCGVPVHVCAPREKYFWLPLSAAEGGRHSLFDEALGSAALLSFLRTGTGL